MARSAAAKSMWCSEVLAQAKSKLAASIGQARKSACTYRTRDPDVRSRASAIIPASRSMAVTSAALSASRRASSPSPQPTSSAAPQPSGTVLRMTDW